MIITEGYILLGGKVFWIDHSFSLELILKLVIGNVSVRGAMYVNLVLEALLKTIPVEGASMLLRSGLVATMFRSVVETCTDAQLCEPYEVINIYLTILSRIMLASPTNITIIAAHAEECNSFGFCQMVRLMYSCC